MLCSTNDAHSAASLSSDEGISASLARPYDVEMNSCNVTTPTCFSIFGALPDRQVVKASLYNPIDSITRLFCCSNIKIIDGSGLEVVLCMVDVA